jgi:hypothetical protein
MRLNGTIADHQSTNSTMDFLAIVLSNLADMLVTAVIGSAADLPCLTR